MTWIGAFRDGGCVVMAWLLGLLVGAAVVAWCVLLVVVAGSALSDPDVSGLDELDGRGRR